MEEFGSVFDAEACIHSHGRSTRARVRLESPTYFDLSTHWRIENDIDRRFRGALDESVARVAGDLAIVKSQAAHPVFDVGADIES